jgi:cytochrome c peroxidase
MGAKPAPAQQGQNPQLIQLGRALFFEDDLSSPSGMACATCHAPQAGFTYPESDTNQLTGTVPGAVAIRYGNRRPPTISYARFIPQGTPTFDSRANAYVGGLFYDGRASSLADQAQAPLQNPNEMNNLVHNAGSPALIVSEVQHGPNAALFQQVFGPGVFGQSSDSVFQLVVKAISAWEASPEVSPFSSKYDAYLAGKVALTAAELDGLRLFTGSTNGRPGGPPFTKNAECSSCHVLSPQPGQGPDLFTDFHYYNIGLPRNAQNPYYAETDRTADPVGYNRYGEGYVDLGLGDFLYPLQGVVEGDYLGIKGAFKAPTLRNVDTRPSPTFVKAYGHNGFFKSLPQVVHFYNTRNLTAKQGEVIDFTKSEPYAGLQGTPLWPAPEYIGAPNFGSPITMINPAGLATGPGRHLGNLGLTPQQEADLVAFLRTLSDAPPPPPSGGVRIVRKPGIRIEVSTNQK